MDNLPLPFKRAGFSFSAIAIRRHIGTLVLTVGVMVMGAFFLQQMPVDLLPSITYPRIGVRINAPGVAPEVAVEEVTKPLEKAFATTEGVQQIYSQTREGQISLNLYFQPGGKIDQALNDATAAFNRARGTLPDTIEDPRIFKFDPSQSPIYEFALTSSTLQGRELRVFADEELARELGTVNGVAAVNVTGGVTEEVRVNVDVERLQSLGLGLADVLDELRDRNRDVSGGRLRGGDTEALSRTVGKFRNAKEIQNLLFEVPGNPPRRVYLRDFAQVIDGTAEQRVFVTLNGESAVKVSILKQPDANTISVIDGVKQRLELLRQQGLVPADAQFTATLDESKFIRNSISNVVSSGLSGMALAAIAVLLFLGSLRQTLIIVLAIPLSTLAALILMRLFGLSLNIFSLGGLALGVGIVVDNSIVMLENIVERAGMVPGQPVQTDLSPEEIIDLSEAGSREVESALVASTTTNLVAVLPFLLIGGFIALLFNELILTISFAVAASLLLSVTVVPMMASRLLAIPVSSRLDRLWILRQFNLRFGQATQVYRSFLAKVLDYRIWVVAIAVISLGGLSWDLADQLPQEILPRINTGQVNLFAQFPPGTSLETNQRVMERVSAIVSRQPETEYAFSTVGGTLFGTNTSENVLRSSINLTLKPGTDAEAFVERVNQDLDRLNLAGIRLRLSPGNVRGLILNNSPVNNADLDVILQGSDARVLREAGRKVVAALDENVTLASFRPDADAPQPEVQIRPDWERASALGLTAQQIGETIQTAIQGSVPTQLQRGDRLVDVRVQLAQGSIQRPSQLEQLPISAQGRYPVRLSDIATVEKGRAPSEIQRINQRQVVLIAGSLEKGAKLSDAIAQLESVLQTIDLPPGVSLLPSSAAESNRQLQNSLALLGTLACFLVFVVMAVQYNSLIDPLVILLTVPLALAGGILGLWLTQTALGATVIVGAVLLVGIVVNNAIIMIELANQIREQTGCDRRTAILQAAPQRLRPILMTTITTVLGMFPLALGIGEGSEFLQPLGVVVFSGLSLATLLTLLIIPCFYVLLHDWVSLIKRLA